MIVATIVAVAFSLVQELPATWFGAPLSAAASGSSTAAGAAATTPAATAPAASAAIDVVGALASAGSKLLGVLDLLKCKYLLLGCTKFLIEKNTVFALSKIPH